MFVARLQRSQEGAAYDFDKLLSNASYQHAGFRDEIIMKTIEV